MNKNFELLVNRHELFLDNTLKRYTPPAARLSQAMNYMLFPGGKRLRPLLVYLCGELLDVEPACLDRIAAAIEITHCYSLIHDDLPAMDNDDFRRGKPSCHRAFDEATAILVGDGMQALAIDMLLSELPQFLTATQVIAVTRELVHASGNAGMVSGQSLDLSELCRADLKEPELQMIHLLKTGKLIAACINMVLAVTNASDEVAAHLRQFAHFLGLVFQMQDDYLDEYLPDSMGKKRASDKANNKVTFATLYEQNSLLNKINEHYQNAKHHLLMLGIRAKGLSELTSLLNKRTESALTSFLTMPS